MTKLDFVKHCTITSRQKLVKIPNELKSKVTTKLSNGLESKLMKVE